MRNYWAGCSLDAPCNKFYVACFSACGTVTAPAGAVWRSAWRAMPVIVAASGTMFVSTLRACTGFILPYSLCSAQGSSGQNQCMFSLSFLYNFVFTASRPYAKRFPIKVTQSWTRFLPNSAPRFSVWLWSWYHTQFLQFYQRFLFTDYSPIVKGFCAEPNPIPKFLITFNSYFLPFTCLPSICILLHNTPLRPV